MKNSRVDGNWQFVNLICLMNRWPFKQKLYYMLMDQKLEVSYYRVSNKLERFKWASKDSASRGKADENGERTW